MEVVIIVVIGLVLVLGYILWRSRTTSPPVETPGGPAPNPAPAAAQQYATERQRQLATIAQQNGWKPEAVAYVQRGKIERGMNQDMVLLAWGGPTSIDHRTVTPDGRKVERWIYAAPDGVQQYVWFAEGRVVRIEG